MRPGHLVPCLLLTLLGPAFAQVPVPPFVVMQPANVTAFAEDLVILTAAIDGSTPMTFQWRKDRVPLIGAANQSLWVTASVASGATFSVALYDLVATNAAGTVTTTPVVVYVTRRPQTITFTAPAAVSAAGSGVVLNASASSSLPVTYTLVSGLGSLSGNVVNGTGGSVVVRASQAGNATYAPADPVERTIAFVAGALSPFITVPPADQTAVAGTSLSLRVTAIGTPFPSFQWQKDGTPLPAATNAVLTLPSLVLTDTGRYAVSLTNIAGTASASAQVTVRAAPMFVTPPTSQSIAAGTPATLGVEVSGFPAPTLQWRKNGTAMAGATNATYTLASATSVNAGSYDVVATNPLGSATSPAAILTVITRNFGGTYLGRSSGSAGDFVLQVRPDSTAAFFSHLPALSAGLIGLAVKVDLAGNFSATLTLIAATTRNVTLRGTIDEVAGTVIGTLAELNASFEGTRATPLEPALASAGVYSAALVGSAAGKGYVVIAPDGQAFMLTASGNSVDSARGTLGANGRLSATTTTQTTVDLGFTDGALRGTVRTPGTTGTTGTIVGAIEGIAGTEHLINLSVRGVTTPASPMIAGFAISGTVAKQVLIRAAGPALGRAPFNVTGSLPDPTLQLFRVSTSIGQNNDWGSPSSGAASITAATTRAGAFPFAAGSADAALLTTLQPGVYTVQIGGGTGVVLAEVYEVTVANEAPGSRRLVNTSTLGVIAPDFPLIAGFVIGGTAPQRVLIRGSGPTLAGAPFNLAGTLANPQLIIYRGSTVVRTNDDWFRDPEAALIREAASQARAFAFGSQSLDAAILTFLEPGAYTAVLSGPPNANAAAATGIALVEIYESSL